eukprot:11815767-Alexandrium_andersonii.AAC.1
MAASARPLGHVVRGTDLQLADDAPFSTFRLGRAPAFNVVRWAACPIGRLLALSRSRRLVW